MSDECITHGVTYPSHGRCPQCLFDMAIKTVGLGRILALADEKGATAARLNEIDSLRESLAERERELGEARAALNCVGCGAALECATDLRRERDALKEKLAAAERVVEAARETTLVCADDWEARAREFELNDALDAYDALSRS